MAYGDYFAQNTCSQLSLIAWANFQRGPHAYRVEGICAALVAKWFAMVHATPRVPPQDHLRPLVNNGATIAKYTELLNWQKGYEQETIVSTRHNIEDKLFDVASGGALKLMGEFRCSTAADFWTYIDGKRQLGKRSFVLSISCRNNWIERKISGEAWSGHSVGIFCNDEHFHVFDPNFGVAVIPLSEENTMKSLLVEMWANYGVRHGDIALVE